MTRKYLETEIKRLRALENPTIEDAANLRSLEATFKSSRFRWPNDPRSHAAGKARMPVVIAYCVQLMRERELSFESAAGIVSRELGKVGVSLSKSRIQNYRAELYNNLMPGRKPNHRPQKDGSPFVFSYAGGRLTPEIVAKIWVAIDHSKEEINETTTPYWQSLKRGPME